MRPLHIVSGLLVGAAFVTAYTNPFAALVLFIAAVTLVY
jgi:hypothetical protein